MVPAADFPPPVIFAIMGKTKGSETDDGVIFLMKGLGMRHGAEAILQRIADGEEVDPGEYYFREMMIFEAPAGQYEWLNKLLAIGSGERKSSQVVI